MTETTPKQRVLYTHHYHLLAAQCNAQRELAPAQLIQQIIEVATEHADYLGVGAIRLQQDGNLWVLSRIAIEIRRYPRLLEDYSLTTWFEGYNRHFSARNFELRGQGGEVIGYARTIWVAINLTTRRPADLSGISYISDTVTDYPCPMAVQGKIRPIDPPQIVHEYRFRVSDIDFNRHVNSARYVELILNQLDLKAFDECYLSRFEIEFKHEAHFDDLAEVGSAYDGDVLITEISRGGTTICLSRSILTPRITQ